MKSSLGALMLWLGWAIALNGADVPVITPEQAKAHVGETVTVEGVVANVHISGKGNGFLNFGAAYPKQVFAAYVPASTAMSGYDLLAMEGKTVRVTGKIGLYKSKPEIIVTKSDQVKPAG
jgi:DNA/RNA endonuclease YhcR with UshA esterase domain